MSAPRRIGKLVATVALAATLAGVSAGAATAAPRTGPVMAPNSFTAYTYGSGPTLADAEANAIDDFGSNYYGCAHYYALVSSTQEPDGSWFVKMAATCSGYV